MTARQFCFVVFTVLALSAGQILFKLAARDMHPGDPWLQQLALNAWLYVAVAVYAIATIVWVLLLRHVALQLAYPFVALTFCFVPLLAHWIVGETLRWQTFAGAMLILLGVWISVGWPSR